MTADTCQFKNAEKQMAEKMSWGSPKTPAGMDHQSTHRNVNQSQTGNTLTT